VEESLAELAAYFRRGTEVPDEELIRLAAAARAGGSRWDGIAAACGVRDYRDITGVVTLPCWRGSDPGADLLFSAAQHAVHAVTGSRGVFAPMSWTCPGCGQQVTDRAFSGRPVQHRARSRARLRSAGRRPGRGGSGPAGPGAGAPRTCPHPPCAGVWQTKAERPDIAADSVRLRRSRNERY